MKPSIMLLVLCLAVSAARPAPATESKIVDLTCPVCTTKTRGVDVIEAYMEAGFDPDGMNWQIGAQVILLVPTTCPKCLYSQFTKQFEKPVDDAVKAKILKGDALHVPKHRKYDTKSPAIQNATRGRLPEETKYPAWVRMELGCQVAALQGLSEKELFSANYIRDFCFRLEEDPFYEPFTKIPKERIRRYFRGIDAAMQEDGEENLAWGQVRLALRLARDVDSVPESEKHDLAIYVFYSLRSHGEHPPLIRCFQAMKKHLAKVEAKHLEKAMLDSIALERKYQKKTLGLLEKILPGFEDPFQKLYHTFLAGEYARRLGDKKKANRYFEEVLKSDPPNERMRKFAKRQIEFIKKHD